MTPDGCATCGAGLASGQRYCLRCAAPVAGSAHGLPELHRAMRLRAAPAPAAARRGGWAGGAGMLRPGSVLVLAGLLLGLVIGLSAGPPEGVLADAGLPYSVTLPAGQRAVAVSTEPAAPEAEAAPAEPDTAPADTTPAPAEPEVIAPADLLAQEPVPTAEPEPAPNEAGEDEETAPPPDPPKPPAFKHVFVIALSELGFADLYGPDAKAAYVRELVPQAALLSGYRAIGEGGLANGIALVSGLEPNPQTLVGCPTYRDVAPGTINQSNGQVKGEGCVYPAPALTVADQITANGLRWRAYAEDQGAGCRHPALGADDPSALPRPGDAYATFRNPFMYFHSIVDLPGCAESSVDLSALPADLADPAKAPALSYLIPDRCRDGSTVACPEGGPRGAEAADAFLREWVPQITASAAFKDGGVLAIVADRPASGAKEPQTGALVLSATARAGSVVPGAYDHYSLLRTIQDGLNLPYLGRAETATSFGGEVFRDGTGSGEETATTGGA